MSFAATIPRPRKHPDKKTTGDYTVRCSVCGMIVNNVDGGEAMMAVEVHLG